MSASFDNSDKRPSEKEKQCLPTVAASRSRETTTTAARAEMLTIEANETGWKSSATNQAFVLLPPSYGAAQGVQDKSQCINVFWDTFRGRRRAPRDLTSICYLLFSARSPSNGQMT